MDKALRTKGKEVRWAMFVLLFDFKYEWKSWCACPGWRVSEVSFWNGFRAVSFDAGPRENVKPLDSMTHGIGYFNKTKQKKKGKGTKRGGKKNRWLGHHLVNKGQTGQTIVGAGAMGKNPAVLTIAFHLLDAWPAGPLKRNKKCITSVICIHTLPSFLFSCSFPSRFFSFFVVHISRLSAIFVQRQSFIDVRHASAPRWIKRNATKMKLCGIGVEGRSEQEKTMRRYLKDAVVDVKSYWHVLHLVLIAESCLHVKGFPFSLGLFLRGQGYSPFFFM